MIQDIEVCEPPSDSISALEFVPTKSSWSRLAAASWNNSVRLWDVQLNQGTAIPRCMHIMDSPILDVAWNVEGSKLYMGDCAGKVLELDVATNKVAHIGAHEAGVRCCNLIVSPVGSYLLTASWDKTAKFWDPRSNSCIYVQSLPDRAYAADAVHPLSVVACAGRKILTFSLEGRNKGVQQCDCPSYGAANSQVRAVAICKGVASQQPVGWFLAKSDGMVIMQSMSNQDHWYFPCHRNQLDDNHYDLYAVNDIKVNHDKKTLATVGSDGRYDFWDCVSRSKLMESSHQLSGSITKCAISGDGQVFAYAVGYDWAQGYEYNYSDKQPKIFMRSILN